MMHGVLHIIAERCMEHPYQLVAWSIGAVLLAILTTIVIKHWKLTTQYPGEPPVVNEGLPLLGSAPQFGKSPLQLLQRLEKAYGHVFTCILAGSRMTFITNAHDACDFIRNTGNRKDVGSEMKNKEVCKHAFGHDMDASERTWGVDQNHVHRLHTTGLMIPKSLDEISSRMCNMMQREIKSRFASGDSSWYCAPMYETVTRLVFCAASKSLFSDDDGVDWQGEVYNQFVKFDSSFASLLMFGEKWLYLHPSVTRARQKLWNVLASISGKYGSTYVQKRSEYFQEHNLPAEEHGAAQLAIFWASHSNSLPAIYWAVAHALNTPGLLSRIRQEAIEVLCSNSYRNSSADTITVEEGLELLAQIHVEDLNKMTVLDSVFTEILRLYSANFVFRQASKATSLSLATTNIAVRENDSVAVYAPTVHYDSDIFPYPFSFRWDRFYDEQNGKSKKFYKDGKELRSPIFAFGGGETMCKGRYFVRNENKITFLAMLIALDMELYHKDDLDKNGDLLSEALPNNVAEDKFPAPDCKAGGTGIIPPTDRDALVFRFRPRAFSESIEV